MAKYRPVSTEIAAPTTSGTAVTVSDAHVVRVTNTASSSPYLVSMVDENDNVVSTVTVLGSEVLLIDKPKSWKMFAANAAVKFVSVTYPT